MKLKVLVLAVLSIFSLHKAATQGDPNNDPNWDWRASTVFTVYPQANGGSPINTTAPFYQGGISPAVQDNETIDGWRLVIRDFGWPTRATPVPHFILYNRHQGLLRIFVFMMMPGTFNEGGIELFWGSESSSRTAALTFLTSRAWALDKPDIVRNNSSVASSHAINANWAFADFPMAYDPATATTSNPRLFFKLWGVQDYDLNLEGFGDLRQVFGTNQPANIATSQRLTPTGLVQGALQSAQGTQATWNGWRDKIGQIANGIDPSNPSVSVQNLRTNLLALKDSWLVSNLGIIGVGVGLIDFLITGGRSAKPETPAPMNFLLNFKLTGSMRTQHEVTGAVTLPLPGGNHTGTPSTPTNLIYTQPMGILNLHKTPIVQSRQYLQEVSPGSYIQFYSYRIKEDLLFDINPTTDLQLQTLEAAIVYHVHPDYFGWFLNWADQGIVELESANNGKYVFRTPYINANWFRFQRINVSGSTDVTVKVKAIFSRIGAPPGTQPVVMVATYEPDFEAGDGIQQPWPPAPQGVTITTNREFEFDPVQQAPPQYAYVGVQTNVSTPAQTNVSGKDYHFYQWSDGNSSNPRAVTPTGNTTLTAMYKAHMTSNSSATLSGNSQRKIIRHGGKFYACYESGGHIWVTTSTDGNNWTTEKLVSNIEPGKTNRNPSVSIYPNTFTRLLVAWEVYGGQSGNYTSQVKVRQLDLNTLSFTNSPLNWTNGLWTSSLMTYGGQFSASPVLAARTTTTGYASNTLLVWHNPMNNGSIQYCILSNNISGLLVSGNPQSFTLAPNPFGNAEANSNAGWAFAWSNGSSIRYKTLGLTAGHSLSVGPEEIALLYGNSAVGQVSLIHTDQQPAIAWVESGLPMNPTLPVDQSYVKFRQRTGSVPGTDWGGAITTWPISGSSASPTMTFNFNQQVFSQYLRTLSIFWEDQGSVYRVDRTENVWSAPNEISANPGYTPSISIFVPAYTGSVSTEVLLSRSPASLYAIQPEFVYYGDIQLRPVAPHGSDGRGLWLQPAGGFVYCRVLSPSAQDRNVGYAQLNDTTVILRRPDFEGISSTPLFGGQGMLRYRVRYKATGTLPADAAIRIILLDAVTGEVVQERHRLEGILDTAFQVNVPMQFSGRELKLKIAPVGFSNSTRIIGEQLFLPNSGNQNIKTKFLGNNLEQDRVGFLPTSYVLHQNYPNPFNPSTGFSFDLPEAGNVSLVIYDVLGRQITELVNGVREAGYHSVTWNATDQASGVYLARFSVIDGNGKQVYAKINKLVLMK